MTKRNALIVIKNVMEDMTLKLYLVGKNRTSHINYLLSLFKVSPTIDDTDKILFTPSLWWRHLWMTLSYNRESTSKQRTFKQILISLLHCFKADIFTEFLTRLTTIIGISLILIVLLPLETSLKRRKLNEMMKVIRRPLFSTGCSRNLWLSRKCSAPEMENFLS